MMLWKTVIFLKSRFKQASLNPFNEEICVSKAKYRIKAIIWVIQGKHTTMHLFAKLF